MRNFFLLSALVACSTTRETPNPAPAQPAPSLEASSLEAPPPSPPPNAQVEIDVAPLAFDWKPEGLVLQCERMEVVTDAKLVDIVAKPADKRTFENTFLAYEAALTDYDNHIFRLTFLKEVHADEAVRAASASCEERSGKYLVRLGARKDLYLALKGYLAGPGLSSALNAADKKLVDVTMHEFKKNGLELQDAQREKLVQLRSRLSELQTRFTQNLDEGEQTIEVTKEELAGLSDAFIARLKPSKDGSKLLVTTAYPDYFPLMETAKNEATRKKMLISFNTRAAKQNVKLLEEAVAIRDEAAKLLGFKTHADYVTSDRMAQSAQVVADFEMRMRAGLAPRLKLETEKLKKLKAAELKKPTSKVEIFAWDWRYYLDQLKKAEFAIDDEATRQYFPADKVFAGMFEVYAKLFSVTFEEVKQAKVWASEGVRLYAVRDAASKRLMAKFYVDLYPRAGKYGHAACFSVGLAHNTDKGYQIPLSVLVTNFNPPRDGKPAELAVSEVVTLFHEFGHVMHASLTTAPYSSLAGTNVATDFVEAPSQMLENWVFQTEVLAKISTGLPPDLAARLIASRKFDAGIRYSRQVFLGTFDLKIHTSGSKVDTDKVAKREWKAATGFTQDPKEKFPAVFSHMMSGYDAGYYGYLWSEVFAADMFSRFEKDGIMSESTGRAYRNIVLAKGRTEEPLDLLKDFLGRVPNEEAFLRQLGIGK